MARPTVEPASKLSRGGLALRADQPEGIRRPKISVARGGRAALMAASRGDTGDGRLTLAFVAGGHEIVAMEQLRVKLLVELPVVLSDSKTLRTEARVVDRTRERELRQTFPAHGGNRVVTMFVPSDWLLPGEYLVEIRAADSPESGTDSFEFVVRP